MQVVDREAERQYLERCMDAFMDHLNRGDFDSHMDEFTVFGGEPPKKPLGFYRTYDAAIQAGYGTYGLGTFLVRKITEDYKKFGRWGKPINPSRGLLKALGIDLFTHPRVCTA